MLLFSNVDLSSKLTTYRYCYIGEKMPLLLLLLFIKFKLEKYSLVYTVPTMHY